MAFPLHSSRSLLMLILMAVICISHVAITTDDLPPPNEKPKPHPQPELKPKPSSVIPYRFTKPWFPKRWSRKLYLSWFRPPPPQRPRPWKTSSTYLPRGDDASVVVDEEAEKKAKPKSKLTAKPMPKPELKPESKPKPMSKPEPKPKPKPKQTPTHGAPH